MTTHKRYLVFTEFDDTGHVIGFYDTLKEAKKVFKEVFNQQAPGPDYIGRYEDALTLPTYKVHATGRYTTSYCRTMQTNGFYTASVFDTHFVENFSLKKFMFERANTIYAYDLENYDTEKTTFVKEALFFIAN